MVRIFLSLILKCIGFHIQFARKKCVREEKFKWHDPQDVGEEVFNDSLIEHS